MKSDKTPPSKLAFFPTLYKDEDFRSIVYRYQIFRMGRGKLIDVPNVMHELFELKSKQIPIFPQKIGYLCSGIPDNVITVNDFILKHTYFPLLYPFIPQKESNAILKNMTMKHGKNQNNLGTRVSKLISSEIRYCPLCLDEDIKKIGESYIHRIHQISHLDVCAKHLVKLRSRCPKCSEPVATGRGKFYIHQAHCQNGHDLRDSDPVQDDDDNLIRLKVDILNDIKFLLNRAILLSQKVLHTVYHQCFLTNGFLTPKGKYNRIKFVDSFLLRYPEHMLSKLGIPLYYIQNYMPKKLLDSSVPGMGNLLLHILIMRMFAGTVEGFAKMENLHSTESIKPLRNGPWVCLNTACSDYNRPVIENSISKPYLSEKKYGIKNTFECPTCKFKYVRYWKEGVGETRNQILNYGELWERKLIETFSQTGNIAVTAKELGVTRDVAHAQIIRLVENPFRTNNVVNKKYSSEWYKKLIEVYNSTKSIATTARYLHTSKEYAKKVINAVSTTSIDDSIFLQTMREISCSVYEVDERRYEAREQIMSLLRENENISRKQLELKVCSHYTWLSRHDREWLESVLPNKVKVGFKAKE